MFRWSNVVIFWTSEEKIRYVDIMLHSFFFYFLIYLVFSLLILSLTEQTVRNCVPRWRWLCSALRFRSRKLISVCTEHIPGGAGCSVKPVIAC